MASLVNRGLGVEGESSIDFSGHFARNDLQDLTAKFDQESVEGGIDLLIDGFALGVIFQYE